MRARCLARGRLGGPGRIARPGPFCVLGAERVGVFLRPGGAVANGASLVAFGVNRLDLTDC